MRQTSAPRSQGSTSSKASSALSIVVRSWLLRGPDQRLTGLPGKEVVEKGSGRGLRFVVGQPRSFVGFDECIVITGDVGDKQVDARHRDTDRLGRLYRDPAEVLVHLGRHVMNGALSSADTRRGFTDIAWDACPSGSEPKPRGPGAGA